QYKPRYHWKSARPFTIRIARHTQQALIFRRDRRGLNERSPTPLFQTHHVNILGMSGHRA
ncbi:hypothetical protein, partial [Roseibium sp. RKSG952]|uniref:hypothetical protein n=1 Tax=Roseibium sp. RKSG952 TaxID=2529384 RepID=UPI001AD92529